MSTASPTPLEYPFDSLPAPGHTIEIAPGLRWVRMRLPFALDHINLWLLDDGEALAVVDCGFAREETREAWNTVLAADGRPLRRVVVTHHHPDHIGLATWLAALGLSLILEGLLPFVAPRAWRQAFSQLMQMRDGQVRFFGLLALLGGLALLWSAG